MMISRVAENCFWLDRYVERADTTARLVAVNRLLILDADIHALGRWKPILTVTGEDRRFRALHGATAYDRDKDAEDFLTWSEDNPNSIRSCLAAARENARMTREVISREMWETINTTWQWLKSARAQREYKKDRSEFYQHVRRSIAELRGNTHNTMLYGQPYHFLQIGGLLERAGQSARLIGVKKIWAAAGGRGTGESPENSAQWVAMLRLCAAAEPFFKRNSAAPTGPLVARFLLQDRHFPRSVLHCLQRATAIVDQIDDDTGHKPHSATRVHLATAATRLAKTTKARLESDTLDATCAAALEEVAQAHQKAHADFFEPSRASA